jgi:nucleoid-associated protein YgaU
MEKGRYREAITDFEKAMTLDPSAPEPYIRLALLYEECLRDPLTALRYYRKYQQVEKDPVKREEVQGWIVQLEQVAARAPNPGADETPRELQVARLQGESNPGRGLTGQSGSPSSQGTSPSKGAQQKFPTGLQETRQGRLQGSTVSSASSNQAEERLKQLETERTALAKSLDDARAEILKSQQAARLAEQNNSSLRHSYEAQIADLKRRLETAEGRLRQLDSSPAKTQIAQLTGELREAKARRDSTRSDYAKATEEIARLKEALNAYATTQASLQKANDELRREIASLRSQSPTRTTTVRQYAVRRGDTLKTIAASPSIYGDSRKWIVIYQANKDKVRDPNKLTPGQVLVIPPG